MASKEFSNYLISEYEHIAEAHFRTISTISAFFRYYLLIAAFPMTILGVLIGFSTTIHVQDIVSTFGLLISLVFTLVAIIGLLLLLYVISLRMDAILYSRTVNGIRKYFYDNATSVKIETKLRTRVLPQSPQLPSYYEGRYFLPVVLTFAFLNSSYLALAIAISQVGSLLNLPTSLLASAVVAWLTYFGLHIVSYYWYAQYREHEYLQSHAMGVDIDGVLNDHRVQFCKILKLISGKVVRPADITRIPVHEDRHLRVTREEENAVFNVVAYYAEMPSLPEAAASIERLRNQFNLEIHLFTYRPRPNFSKDETEEQKRATYQSWVARASKMLQEKPYPPPRFLGRIKHLYSAYGMLNKLRLTLPRPLRLRPIDVITRCWLNNNGFVYDDLMIERGSEMVSDPKGKFRNRYVVARKRKFRFFVEDYPEQAAKLAYVCDIVFLLKQPYNHTQKLPDNVIRVDSWEEIFRNVGDLL